MAGANQDILWGTGGVGNEIGLPSKKDKAAMLTVLKGFSKTDQPRQFKRGDGVGIIVSWNQETGRTVITRDGGSSTTLGDEECEKVVQDLQRLLQR